MALEQPIKIFNTLTRQKEELVPINDKHVGIYACGQTVYDKATIGNLRTYIFEDILRRVLKYNGYDVKFVQNITDVGHLTGDRSMGEDKLEKRAREKHVDARELARSLEAELFADAQKLNILPPDASPHAADDDSIREQISYVEKLEKLGFTYRTSDGIYFDTSKSPNYGELAHLNKEGLREGARVEINPEKRNPTDFALWKFSPVDGPKRQMEWESPWGTGFPGWHIECSAMSIKHLGVPFDIHCGAIDHIPVHHTNEIAQNEAIYGKKTVNYWMHGGFLLVNNQRMGKSLGNAYTIADLEAHGFNPLAFRYLTYMAHYRQELNYTDEAIESAMVTLNKLYRAVGTLLLAGAPGDHIDENWKNKFLSTINDDLNMPKAIALVWDMLKDRELANDAKLKTLLDFDRVLALDLEKRGKANAHLISSFVPPEIQKIRLERDQARRDKNWPEADRLREELKKLGWNIIDNEDGSSTPVPIL